MAFIVLTDGLAAWIIIVLCGSPTTAPLMADSSFAGSVHSVAKLACKTCGCRSRV